MIEKIYREIFYSIKNGDLEKVISIWNLAKNIEIYLDIHIFNDYAFKISCLCGNLDISKWIWNMGNINLLSNEKSIFINYYQKNIEDLYLEILFDCDPAIKISNNEIFLYSCSIGNIEIVKWLWNLHTSLNIQIDIHSNKDEIFYMACFYNQIEIAKWLCELCDKYYFEIENNKITKYKVLNIYDKILQYSIKDDFDKLKLFFKCEESQIKNKMCTICKFENEKYIINLKCNINSKQYDHYYCINCFCNWYRNNDKKCLCCFCDFDLDNIVLLL